MNSDSDSDWDSMSEAPHITNNKSMDNNTKYPPPQGNNTETRNKINSHQHLVTHSKSHTQQSENDQRESKSINDQKAAVKQHLRNNQQYLEHRTQNDHYRDKGNKRRTT